MDKKFLVIGAVCGAILIAIFFLLSGKSTYYCADPADMERCRYSMYNCKNSLLILDIPPVVMNFDISMASVSTCHIVVEIKGLAMTCNVPMDKVKEFWDDPNEMLKQCTGPLVDSMLANVTANRAEMNLTG
jgi:hypothetical protein